MFSIPSLTRNLKFHNYLKRSSSFRLQNYATRKRFYKGTGIIQADNKWEVTLDHRRLKTPIGKVLTIDSEPLARGVAAEWDAQISEISPPVMHLTSLCSITHDNPENFTPHDVTSYILNYFPTDTLLYHAKDEEPLKQLQEMKWTPIIEWFEKRFGVTQEVTHDLYEPPVSPETRAALARHLLSYDLLSLNAICFGVEALKSPLLMLACMERVLEPTEAVLLARLEEEYQSEHWGRVPWAHELHQAELTARVAAALLVLHCNTDRHSAKAKKTNSSNNT